MDGKEIQSLINRDAALKIQFLGVFAADELPTCKWERTNCKLL